MQNKRIVDGVRGRPLPTRLALAALLAITASAHAFQFDTGDDDLSIRWDNTVKGSLKVRTAKAEAALNDSFRLLVPGVPASAFPQALNFNAGDQNFQGRGVVSERLDILSEFDAVWKRDFGVRLSAAGWYDQKLHERTQATDGFVPQTPVDEFAQSTKTRAGRKAELLDAFVFGGWRLDNQVKVTARLGRHGLQYGESLFFGDNGIARAQGPIDIDKLLASPGAQFKEIIRPVPQLSGQVQFSPEVSLGGYYQFSWEEDRLPAAGSYFSNANIPWGSPLSETVDLRTSGAPFAALYTLSPGADQKPRNSGQFGVQLKWRVGEVDLGFYAAQYHDKGGQLYGNLNPASTFTVPGVGTLGSGQWYYAFGEKIKTVGTSATYSLGDFNLAGEVSVRDDMPLRSTNMIWATGFGGQPQMAKGKTAHANFSWLATFGPSLLSQESSFLGELAFNRVMSYDDPQHSLDEGRTRSATAIRMIFSPSYRQIVSGLDLSVPIGVGYTLKGNSAVTAGWGAQDTGDASVGLEGNYLGVWQFGLTYTKYLGKSVPFVDYSPLLTGGHAIFGHGNALGDRDFVALSLRRSF